jgi:hypothetical protein
VTIEPLDGGARARVTLDWHDPFRISEENDQITSRVDVGVFAHNGVHDSAPAILSWAFPAHETRTYEPGPDGAPRIAAIDHADPAKAGVYADPLLHPRADWRDAFRYDAEGNLLGWTRSREGVETAFAPDGARVLETADGSPPRAEPVGYALEPGAEGTLLVREIGGAP